METSPPGDLTALLSLLRSEEYCYLTTVGRVSGRPHEIEIWFVVEGHSLFLLSGNHKSDWVKNLHVQPAVTVRIAQHIFTGAARLVQDEKEDLLARTLIAEKYHEWNEDKSLSEWALMALPVAIELHAQHTRL